jgi:hypothetical protein
LRYDLALHMASKKAPSHPTAPLTSSALRPRYSQLFPAWLPPTWVQNTNENEISC